MTLKDIKKHYRVMKMDGYYNLSTLNVDTSSRNVHKYICTVYKTPTQKFHIKDCEPVSKIELLLEQIENYLDSLEYDSEYFCPSYRKGTAQDWFLYDKLNEYGFKRGGYNEPDGFHLKRDSIYGGTHSSYSISYVIDEETEEISIGLNTGRFSWVSVKTSFDLKDIHKKLDSLLKPVLLSEGAQNIILSDKMEMSNVEIALLELKDFDVTTSKVDLKTKLLELAETL